jgi:UDPglucose 6-dehydrogenase
MKIGLLGKGTVGNAVYEGLEFLGHTMSFYDPAYADSRFEHILDTDLVFICVPTDQADNGDCDTSIVESTVAELARNDYRGLVCIKSTVIPGTSEELKKRHPDLRIASVPEFLRAKTALGDFVHNHDLLVIGTHCVDDFELVKRAHGFYPRYVAQVTPTEAEIVKYFNNVHHAMQVTFANITFEVCQKLGANYMNVYNAITQRDCINPSYLMANKNMRGYGGHCLPKDTAAWNNLIKKLGLDYQLIDSVIKDNEKFIK